MKKYFLILFISVISANYLIAQNLDSLNQFTGWDESNSLYKIQKFTNEKFTYSKVLDSGDKLFTADTAMNFRIWDLESGKIVYSRFEPHLTPVYLLNDSTVVFRHKDLLKSDSSGSIWAININSDSIIGKSKERYVNYFYYTNCKDKDNNLMVNYGNNQYPNSSYYSICYIAEGMISLNNNSNYMEYLYGKNVKKYICERMGFGYNQYTDQRWISKIFYINNDTNQFSKLIEKSAYGTSVDYTSVKKFNLNNSLAFIYYPNKLLVFNMDSLKLIGESELPSNYPSFVILPNNYIIFFNSSTSEFVRYYYAQNSVTKFKIDIKVDKSDIYLVKNDSEYLLVSKDGKIACVYKDSIDSQLPEISVDKSNIIENEIVKFTINSLADIESANWDFGDGTYSEELNPSHIYLDSGKYNIKLIYKTEKRKDTLLIEDLVNVEKIYYPRLKSDKYFGIAPLSINVKNVTKDFPNNVTPEWIIDSISAGNSDELNTILSEGTHKITMKFEFNGRKYVEAIYVKVDKEISPKYIAGSSFEGYFSDGMWGSVTTYEIYSIVPLENDKYILYYMCQTSGKNADRTDYYANIISDSFYNSFSIPNIKDWDWAYCAFPKMGYIVCNSNEINVYNINNKILFTKKYDWRGKRIALLNTQKFIGKLEGDELEVYDRRLELQSKIELNKYVDLQDTIKKTFLIGVEKGDPSYFHIAMQTKNKFAILQFDENCNFKNYIIQTGSILKIDKKNSSLFINFLNLENQKFLMQLNDQYKIARNYDLSGIDYESILANDSCFYITREINNKDLKVYLYDYNITNKELIEFKFDTDKSSRTTKNFYFNDDNTIFYLLRYRSMGTYGGNYYFSRFLFPETIIPDSVQDPDPPDTTKSDTIVYKINTPFPNPAEDFVKIEVDILENPKVEIYNVLGTLVPIDYSKTKRKDKDLYWINLSLLPKGTYYYKISNGQKSFTGRFVKE